MSGGTAPCNRLSRLRRLRQSQVSQLLKEQTFPGAQGLIYGTGHTRLLFPRGASSLVIETTLPKTEMERGGSRSKEGVRGKGTFDLSFLFLFF
jgi:hypothetical protein